MQEDQNIEWKESWRDEYLKWICGFANADGGKLFIGINDKDESFFNIEFIFLHTIKFQAIEFRFGLFYFCPSTKGEVAGIDNAEKLLDEIPNKVRNHLGVIVETALHYRQNKKFIEIKTEAYPFPVSYKGKYYIRSGSTKQELKAAALDRFLLRKQGKHWDGVPVPYISVDDLKPDVFKYFSTKAIKSKRLEANILDEGFENLLDKLHLIENKYLTRASILLFHSNPEKFITGAYIKIGYFRTDENLMYQDVINGDLFRQVEKTMDLLLTKYLKAAIKYERIYRVEEYDYPEPALREALINAVVHKDYSSGNPIQISVYDDKIMFWNDGHLPETWTVEKLKQKHSSIPFNPDIASTFFRAGMIEAWGRGTIKIIEECKSKGLVKPIFEYDSPGFWIIFTKVSENQRKSINTEGSVKSSVKSSVKILELMQKNSQITIPELANEIGITTRAVEKQIDKLKTENKLKRAGGKKYGFWELL